MGWSRPPALLVAVWVLAAFLLISWGKPLRADTKDCDKPSLGVLPLTDLRTGTYSRDGGTPMSGGLYPGGNNNLPLPHRQGGAAAAALVQPLDTNGQTTGADKKIVIAGIGYSNTTHFFRELEDLVGDNKSDDVELVRLSAGRGGAHIWADPDNPDNPIGNPWLNAQARLVGQNLSAQQVQVVFHQHALPRRDELHPPLPWPDGSPADVQGMMEEIARKTLEFFPNTQLAFWVGNDYQEWGEGETVGGITSEPYRYESGFAIKWMLEKQINGDPSLSYDPATKVAPWMAWADYQFTDGVLARLDRLSSPCESFQADGTHPAIPLRMGQAMRLHNLLQTSPLTDWMRPADGYRPAVGLLWPWAREEEVRPTTLLQAVAAYNGAQKSIAHVEFFVDGLSVGIDDTPPYVHALDGLLEGKYQVKAEAHGSDLASWETEEVTLTMVDVGQDLLVAVDTFEAGTFPAGGWGWLEPWRIPDTGDPVYVQPFLTTEDNPKDDYQVRLDASSFLSRVARLGVSEPDLEFLWKGELSQDEIFEVSFTQSQTAKTVVHLVTGPVSQTDFAKVVIDMDQFQHFLGLAMDFRFELLSATPSDHVLLDNVLLKKVDALDSFVAWATRRGIAADINGNPDGDNLTNLKEYAFLTEPLMHNTLVQAGNWEDSVTELGVDYRVLNYRTYTTRTDLGFTIQEKLTGLPWAACATCVDELGLQSWPLEAHRVSRPESPDLEGLRVVVSYTP